MLRKLLYFLFKHPSMKPMDEKTTPRRLKRSFVMMRVHVGENGFVKTVTIQMSCGDKSIDQMAIAEIKGRQFAQPRVGHKAVAQWHNMRWEVPSNLLK
ncbi:energy transducer TonB [Hydromonas duriensis]|nr:hypothetical protein [Hydromonas duriensis]